MIVEGGYMSYRIEENNNNISKNTNVRIVG